MPSSPRALLCLPPLLAAFFLCAPAAAETTVALPGHVLPRLRGATLIERAPGDEKVDLSLVVRIDQELMDKTLAQLYGPGALRNKRFLTSSEFAQKFELRRKRETLKDFARQAGLNVDTVHDSPSSLVVRVSGPAGLVEKTFGVELNHYRTADGKVFRANDRNPSIPGALAAHLRAVIGFSDYRGAKKPHLRRPNPPAARAAANAAPSPRGVTGTGFQGALSPSDIKSIYGLNASGLTGSGQTVALVEFDGYRTADVTLYENDLFASPHPNPTVSCVTEDNPTSCGLCGASQNRACTSENPNNDGGMIEVALDIDMVLALSSGAANILVYTAFNTNADDLNIYDWIASDNRAQVVSSSWGEDEEDETSASMLSEQTIFQQMAAQGQSVFAAAGDAGAYDASGYGEAWSGNLLTDDPASQPYVTGVGGTSLSGTLGGSISETVWNEGCSSSSDPADNCSANGAGGGGVANWIEGSTVNWTIPSFQTGVLTAYSTAYRNVPDVSLNSDPDTSAYNICVGGTCNNCFNVNNTCTTSIGGTSAAAPLWAAMTAVLNQQRALSGQGTLGFANPTLYSLAAGSNYNNLFNDITQGNNGFYTAGTGYDNASGWGSYKANALIYALGASSNVAAAATAFTNVGSSSMTVNWTAPAAINGIQYTAQISADGFNTILASSVTYNSFARFGTGGAGAALTPGTTYAFQVQATYASMTSNVSALGQAETLAATPVSLTATALSTMAVSLSWGANGNLSGTPYEISWSLDGFVSNFSTPIAFAADFTGNATNVTGLSASTTYSFRVRAENSASLPSAFSTTATTETFGPPSAVLLSSAALGVSSITWNWTAPLANGVTDYFVFSSSNGVVLATTTAQTFTLTGLAANTPYGVQVQPANAYGNGPLTASSTIFTLAAPPVSLALTSVGYSSITVQWAANGDPAGTQYQAQSWSAGSATTTLTLTGLTTTFAGLAPFTTYFTQVSALNGSGIAAAGGVVVATATLPSPPATAPGNFLAATLGVSSISWTWNAVGGSSDYAFYPSTGGPAIVLAGLSFVQTGLSVNGAYGAAVAAANSAGQGPLSSTVTGYTLAAAPAGFSVTSVGYSSVTLQWTANSNPGGTQYQAQLWTVGGGTTTYTLSGLTTTFLGLSGATSYYMDVAALNGAGIAAAAPTITTETLPTPIVVVPAALAATTLGQSSVSWTWDAIVGATSYEIFIATGPGPGALAATTPALTYSATGLNPNTSQIAYVSGGNASGEGPLTSGVTAYTAAAAPTGAALNIWISSLSVTWNADGNPAGTRYQLGYGTGASTTTITISTTAATLTGLASATTYFISLQALNSAGAATPAAAPLTAVTLPVQAAAAAVTNAGAVITFAPPQGPIVVSIPAAAFTALVNVTLTAPGAFPNARSAARLTGTGVGLQILLDEAVQPQQPVTLSISYSGTSFTAYNPEQLLIARYDPTDNVWVPLPSTPHPDQQLVTAMTNHFSLFQIMASVAAANLSSVKVFPNPFRPSRGETAITFADLPAGATLKIYDLLGEKVRELQANGAGMAAWDGKNSHGESAASGVYFVLAGSGSSRTILKVAIQR